MAEDWKSLRDDLATRPNNRSFADVERALRSAGFVPKSAMTGTHVTFKKPGYPTIITIPYRRKGSLFTAYTKKAIHAIDDSRSE